MRIPQWFFSLAAVFILGTALGMRAVAAKNGVSLLTPDELQALKASLKGQVNISPDLATASDAEIWDYVPPAELRRAVFLGPTDVGCPVHGKELFRVGGGFYPWKRSADKPWQVQCPVGGESYPSNDFGAYFRAGMKEKLDTTKPYVDDGTGWVDAKGNRFFFVGYWVFWQRWYDVLKGIRAFTDAYLATDDEAYAHKATVLFCALAQQYPKMDYPKQGVQGCGGMILPWCWENDAVVTPLSECYDRLFPYLKQDGDAALREFLKARIDLGPRQQIEQRFIQTVIKTSFTTDMYWSNECDHQLALANLALAWDNADPARGVTTRQIIDWLINNGGDNSLEELLFNSTYRDGFPCEGAIGYSQSIASRQLRIAERLQRCGVNLFQDFPRLKQVAGCWLDMTLADGHCPSIGDSGSVLGSSRPWDAVMLHLAWENYREPKFAQALAELRSWRRTPISPDRSAEFAQVVQEHGAQLNHRTRNLGGMGLAILEAGGPASPRGLALYYGSPAGGHSHHDRLNIEFFDHSRSMMPDLGYPDQWSRKAGEFTSNSIGHYAVLVDEQGEKDYMAGYLEFIKGLDGVQIVSARAERCFPGTSLYRRTSALVDIAPDAGYVVDVFRVRGGRRHDWSFHLPPVSEWAVEGLTLTAPQAKGTLAGEDVAEGAEMPAGRPNCGFNWLTHIQRGRPEGAFTFLSKTQAPYASLRMALLAGCAQDIVVGDLESPRIKASLPPTMKWLLARNAGADNLASVFAAVIEACPDEPRVRDIRRLPATGGREPLAFQVTTAMSTDTFFADETGETPVRTETAGECTGRWAMVRTDADGVSQAVLIDGQRLAAGGVAIATTPAWAGTITGIDFKKNTLDTDTVLPAGDALKGEWMILANPRHSTCYEIARVEALPAGSRIALTEIPPMVGKGCVERIDEPARTIHTDTRWRIFGKDYIWSNDFGPVLAGYTLMNEDLTAGLEIDACKLMPSRARQWWKPEPAWIKVAGTAPFAARFTDTNGDGRIGFWVYDVAPGAAFRIPGAVSLRRIGPERWSLRHTGGDTALDIPCRQAPATVAVRPATGAPQTLPCTVAAAGHAAHVVVPGRLASPVTLQFGNTEKLDLTDTTAPVLREVRVDGKPVPLAEPLQFFLAAPPRVLEFSFADEKSAIDPRTVSVQTEAGVVHAGQDGVRLDVAAGDPRAATLRLEPGRLQRWAPQTAPTAYRFTVTCDDTAVDDARAEQAFRLVLMPAIPDGAVFLSDLTPVKAFAHAGLKRDCNYQSGELRLAGVPYPKGLMLCPETTNGPANYGEAVYDLPAGTFKTFHTVVGIDDAAGGGSVVFSVQVRQKDGEWQTRFKSPVLAKGSAPQTVEIPLGDAAQLRLYTDAAGDIGCDHAVFGLARFEP